MIDTTKLTAEWLAGFFDGEGCVSIRQGHRTGGFCLKVNLTQANFPLLKAIADKYEASGPYTKCRKTKTGKESTVYEISWQGKYAKPILELLRNLVIVKQRQVELALEFIDTLVGSGFRYDDVTTVKRNIIVSELRKSNHAGPFKPVNDTVMVN